MRTASADDFGTTPLKKADLKEDLRVVFMPYHARGEKFHPSCELGNVVSWSDSKFGGTFVEVLFDSSDPENAKPRTVGVADLVLRNQPGTRTEKPPEPKPRKPKAAPAEMPATHRDGFYKATLIGGKNVVVEVRDGLIASVDGARAVNAPTVEEWLKIERRGMIGAFVEPEAEPVAKTKRKAKTVGG